MSIRKVTQEAFPREVLGAKEPVLVEFHAPWCVYCRRIAPVLERVAQAYENKMLIAQIDTDACPALAARYGVETIPALLLFRDGQPGSMLVAPASQTALEAWLDAQL